MNPRLILLLGILVAFQAAGEAQSTSTVNLVMSDRAAAQVKFGAQELARSLETRHGLKVRFLSKSTSSADLQIYLSQRGDGLLNQVEKTVGEVVVAPESYRIASSGERTILVEGSDATGAMYGALDLAEQVAQLEVRTGHLAQQIRVVNKSPFLSLRGINFFLTVQDIDSADGALWSDAYWNGFLDMMARNRYNLLDIHGPCDAVTVTFPNGFSYFVSLPDFPQVGVGPERARKNMERLREIVRIAGDRGIKVAYMNYEAPAPIGPWKTRQFGVDERWVGREQSFLQGPELEDYTRQAVATFLKQLPELWMFGFRIGESGQPEDFYKKTYLAALKEAPPGLNLYVRTWIADPAKVRELAASTPHRLFIEPKYNGEQLGSPYQAVLGGREYPASGSYEDYTNQPRNYSILWQIRAHGTHRIFFWGSPEFARRTVRSCKLGDGVGFSMESMEAYGPARDYIHNDPKVGHNFYHWMYERQWFWHMVWGRTAFDPEVSEAVFIAEFVRRFGGEMGPQAYRAVVESSRIIPFIYSYHTVGLDHQEFAPEFETGDHILDSNFEQIWTGSRFVPFPGNNDTFLKVRPIDRTAMVDPAGYVDLRLAQESTGRMTPDEAAHYLDEAADASRQGIFNASNDRVYPGELDCLRRDVEALAALGRYYSERIRSATHLEFYRRTFHHPELQAAYSSLQRAIEHWDRLAEVADGHFGFVPEPIRMGVNQFRWRDEGRTLGVDLAEMNQLEMEFSKLPRTLRYRATIGHVPPVRVAPEQPLSLSATLIISRVSKQNPGQLSLFFRTTPQGRFEEMPLQLSNESAHGWTATIPAQALKRGRLEYYFEVRPTKWAHYTSTAEKQVYSVPITSNISKPEVIYQEVSSKTRGETVTFEIAVHSSAQVRDARVFYKAMPADRPWLLCPMQRLESGGYRASVPLSPEGLLYYFEVIDEEGNATNYPNFLERTPYFVIDSWAASNAQTIDASDASIKFALK